MKRTVIVVVTALLLVAAVVEKDGLSVVPAAPDEVRDAIELPVWKGKVETPTEKDAFVEILVTAEGKYWVEGTAVDLKKLTERLVPRAEVRRDMEHPMQPSCVPVLLRAPKDLEWRKLQVAQMAVVDPDVRFWRVYFAAVDGDGKPVAVPFFFPRDRGILKVTGVHPAAPLTLRLDLPRGADKTRVLVDDSETGRGYMGFAMAEDRLAKRLAAAPELRAVIDGREKVPYGDVIKALQLVRKVGFKKVDFAWGPPPGQRVLDEPKEIPVPGFDEIAKIRKCRPLVQRGKIRVWPAAKPEVRKAVKLPSWPLKAPGKAPKEEELVEVLIGPKGELTIGGHSVDLRKLTMEFLVWAEVRRDEQHPMQPSLTPVVFHASKDVRWREIQWAMQAAADPDVRMFRLYFATRTKDGSFAYVPIFLPTHRMLRKPGEEPPPVVNVELKRKRADKVTRVKLLDSELGAGEEAFAILAKRLKAIGKANPNLKGELNAWAWTPCEDAMKVIAAFYAADINEFQIVGAPPPGKRPK